MRMLIQKFDDGFLTEIYLEALHLDLDLARCEALLGLYPAELRNNMCRRPLIDPRVALGIVVTRSIDGHLLVLKSDRSPSHQM